MVNLPIKYSKNPPHQRRLVREEYVRLQEGKCHYCGAPLDGPPREDVAKKRINRRLFPPNFFRYPVHLHHNHDTDDTIGAVHNHCNAVLFEYEGE